MKFYKNFSTNTENKKARLFGGNFFNPKKIKGSNFNVVDNPALNHQLKVMAGVLENNCREILQNFFNEHRK